MPVLSFNVSLYRASGLWRPREWSSSCYKLLHGMYCLFVIYLMLFLVLAEFMDLIVVVDNIDDFISNFLMILSFISGTCKIFTTIVRHERIINLIEILEKEPCRARGQEEMDIQAKFDRFIRLCTISYFVLVISSTTGCLVATGIEMSQGKLPFRAWVPYDCSSPLLFWLTSLQEVMALIVALIVTVATETSRMVKTGRKQNDPRIVSHYGPKRTSILSAHVRHHLCIIRYAKIFNEAYSQVLFTQFFISILILCSCVYYLSYHVNFMDMMTTVIYVFSLFLQIFIYCWAGNEVIFKSIELGEAVYQMNWMLMGISEQKDLLMIMMRSARPIRFTSSFLVTLSLESYGNILKTSYSAFSVLQQS